MAGARHAECDAFAMGVDALLRTKRCDPPRGAACGRVAEGEEPCVRRRRGGGDEGGRGVRDAERGEEVTRPLTLILTLTLTPTQVRDAERGDEE